MPLKRMKPNESPPVGGLSTGLIAGGDAPADISTTPHLAADARPGALGFYRLWRGPAVTHRPTLRCRPDLSCVP